MNQDVMASFIGRDCTSFLLPEKSSWSSPSNISVDNAMSGIRIFLEDHEEVFILSFGNIVDAMEAGKILKIKKINLTEYTKTNYGWLWNDEITIYKLCITCSQNNIIELSAFRPFKIYHSLEEIYREPKSYTEDLDYNY